MSKLSMNALFRRATLVGLMVVGTIALAGKPIIASDGERGEMGKPTYESVRNEFQIRVRSLLSEDDAADDLPAELASIAAETFGAHPALMRMEAERRFEALPQFESEDLVGYIEHKTWAYPQKMQPSLLPNGAVWLFGGSDPEELAEGALAVMLARQLKPERLSDRLLFKKYCPDKVYRLDTDESFDLVVESLDDLFVVKLEMTEVGAYIPTSVKWMKEAPEVCIEARIVENDIETGKSGDPTVYPPTTVRVGSEVTFRLATEIPITASKIVFAEGGETTIENVRQEVVIYTVETGWRVEVTPELDGDRIRLDGCVTICEVLDTRPAPSSNEGPASYSFKKDITPFSAVVAPGDGFVTIPTASRGDKKFGIALRVVRVERD